MPGVATFTLIVTELINKKGESKSEVTQDLFNYDGPKFDSEDFVKSANVSAISVGVKIGNFELSINIGTGDFIDFSFGLLG